MLKHSIIVLIASALTMSFALDVDLSTPLSYGGSQDQGSAVVYNNGNAVSLVGNAWKTFQLAEPYTLTPETQLVFGVDVFQEGEIIGIGLDTQVNNINAQRSFQISGSQTWGIQEFRGQSGSVTIPIGQYLTGTFTHLVLIGDDDRSTARQSTYWNNISIVERTPALPVLRLKAEETPILQEYEDGGLVVTERAMISRIQNITDDALDFNDGYTLSVDVASTIRSEISYIQSRVDIGHPSFFWTPVSESGRDALLRLAEALEDNDEVGIVVYDGPSAAGSLQSALRVMDARYSTSNDG